MKPLLDTQQLMKQLQKVPLKQIQQGLNLLLVLALAWLLARLTWQLLPADTPVFSPRPDTAVAVKQSGGVSLAALTGFSLFGKASVEPVKTAAPVVTEAPKTQLNVKLTGLVAVGSELRE